MVATDEPLGSAAGVEILKQGGNAVDAAVAVAFALAVVEPAAGNIGGGGFMLVRLADGRTNFFDYREVAPAKASREMYIRPDGTLDPEASTIGYRSVAVPGTVAGLELALKTYGTMKFRDVMAPAIRLAEDGIPVSEKLARELERERPKLGKRAAKAGAFFGEQADFSEQRADVQAGGHFPPAGVGGNAKADSKKGREGILSGQDGANTCRGHGAAGRAHRAPGFGELQAENSRSPAGLVRSRGTQLGNHFVAAAEFGRRGDDRSAEHAARCAAERMG